MMNKVLILSASAGAGHVRAAQAIEKAFVELNAAHEVKNIDSLEYTSSIFHKLYSKAYVEIVNRSPEIFGWLYDHFDKPWQNERRRLAFDKLNTRPFVRMLESYQPDIVVCTHFLPAEIISWLRDKKRINTRQVIVVTDFDLHAFWLCHNFEHYFVAIEETKVHLEQLGVSSDKITISGIPIDPVIAEHKDKGKMCQLHNLKPDLPTILVSAGGFGMGPVEKLIQSLINMQKKAQIVVICGKNEELKQRVDTFLRDLPANLPILFKSLGYTAEMDTYMSAADLILGKTGGLTISEALAKGLGFVIVDPVPGQEERNADHLLEEGVAIKCNNWPVLSYKIDKLLNNPQRIAEMQFKARSLARPSAAYDIVNKLMSL
jgi:processive 1,2-diacylglycerol beta-glucosyltransferase